MANLNNYEGKQKYLVRNIMEIKKEIVRLRLKIRKLKRVRLIKKEK
jgi:hypothetical protein